MKAEPRPCKVCKEPIQRAAPLSPKTCLKCYASQRRAPAREPRTVPAYRMTRATTVTLKPAQPNPKAGEHRDRALLDLAHRVHTCTNCGAYVEAGCEPAHANGAAFGKGMSIKADDFAHAAMCPACHRFLDQAGTHRDPSERYIATRAEKLEMWLAAHFKTMALYWKAGWICVSAPGQARWSIDP